MKFTQFRAVFSARSGSKKDKTKAIMAVVVSLIILLSALYIILSKTFPPETDKWAFGVIGVLLGYWLK
jgi:hypothetical protein